MLLSCVLFCVVSSAFGNLYSVTDHNHQDNQKGHYDFVKSIVYTQSTGFDHLHQKDSVPTDKTHPSSDTHSIYIHNKVPYKIDGHVAKPLLQDKKLARPAKNPNEKRLPEFVTASLEASVFDMTFPQNSSDKAKPDDASPNLYFFEKQFSHEEKLQTGKPAYKMPLQYHIETGVSYFPGKKYPMAEEAISDTYLHRDVPKFSYMPQVRETNEYDYYFDKHFSNSAASDGKSGRDYQAGPKSTKIRQQEHKNRSKNFTSAIHYTIGISQGSEHHNSIKPPQISEAGDYDTAHKQHSIKPSTEQRDFTSFANPHKDSNGHYVHDNSKISGVAHLGYQPPAGGQATNVHNYHSPSITPSHRQNPEANGKLDNTYPYYPKESNKDKHSATSLHNDTEFRAENNQNDSLKNDKSPNVYSDKEVKPWYGYNKYPVSNEFSPFGGLREYYSSGQPGYFGQTFDLYNPYAAYVNEHKTWGPHNIGGDYTMYRAEDYTSFNKGEHRGEAGLASIRPEIATQMRQSQGKIYQTSENDYMNMWKPQSNYGGTTMSGIYDLSSIPDKYYSPNFYHSMQGHSTYGGSEGAGKYSVPSGHGSENYDAQSGYISQTTFSRDHRPRGGPGEYPFTQPVNQRDVGHAAVEYRATGNFAEPTEYGRHKSSFPAFTAYHAPLISHSGYHQPGHHPFTHTNRERLPFLSDLGRQTVPEDAVMSFKNMLKMSGIETADANGPQNIYSFGKVGNVPHGDGTISTDLLKYLSMMNDEYSLKVRNANPFFPYGFQSPLSSGAGRLSEQDGRSTDSWPGLRGRDDSAGSDKPDLTKFQRFEEIFPVYDSSKKYASQVHTGESEGDNTSTHTKSGGFDSNGLSKLSTPGFQDTSNNSPTASDRRKDTASPVQPGIVTKHKVITVRKRRIEPAKPTQVASAVQVDTGVFSSAEKNTTYSNTGSTDLQKNLTLSSK